MITALVANEHELFPDRYSWTVAQCSAMAADGTLVGRVEVLDGEVVSKTGQKPAHAPRLTRLIGVMMRAFQADFVRVQSPITPGAPDKVDTEPETAIAVTREQSADYARRHPSADDLVLAVGVSDTSLRTDLLMKAPIYAQAGVPEYWVVDLIARQLHVHKEGAEDGYRHVAVLGENDAVPLNLTGEPAGPISDLLPPVAD